MSNIATNPYNKRIDFDSFLNNPYSLGDSKYSTFELNNLSWLKSAGQWNLKAVYPAMYNKLVAEFNKEGSDWSIKLHTDSDITDYDYVINTTEETFRLPVKTVMGYYNPTTSAGVRVFGDGKTLGLLGGGAQNYGLGVGSTHIGIFQSLYATQVGNKITSESFGNSSLGISKDPAKSGLRGTTDIVLSENSNLLLYFYVGETVQNANLIDAGRIQEELSNKLDKNTDKQFICACAMPSNKYDNLTIGPSDTVYRAHANGYYTAAGKNININGQLWLHNKNMGLYSYVSSYLKGLVLGIFIPAKKGDEVVLSYADFNVEVLRFIYAQGET